MDRSAQGGDTVAAALVEVVQAGQRLMADRLELAARDGRKHLELAAARFALVLFGGLVLLGGLVILDVMLVDQLRRTDAGGALPLLYCALAHLVIGAVLLAEARRRAGRAR